MNRTFVRFVPVSILIAIALVLAVVLADDGTQSSTNNNANLVEGDLGPREFQDTNSRPKEQLLSPHEHSVIEAITDLRQDRQSVIDGTILEQPVDYDDETQHFSDVLKVITASKRLRNLTSPNQTESERFAQRLSTLREGANDDQELIQALELAARLLDRKGEDSKSAQSAKNVELYHKLAYKLRAMIRRLNRATAHFPIQAR